MNDSQKLDWLILHLRYTQALCEIILENMSESDKAKLIQKVKERVKEIS